MAPREKLIQLNPFWDNNPSINKSIDEWKALFMTLNSCEEADSEEMVEKAMNFSTQPATMLLLRTKRNAKTLTAKTENLKLDVESVILFDILLEKQDYILGVQK